MHNRRDGVTFHMFLEENHTKPKCGDITPAISWLPKRRINDTASFSHSLKSCKGQTVVLDHYSLLQKEQGRGLGTEGMRHLLRLYQGAGAEVVEVPAPNTKGTRCYKKCGMSTLLGLHLRVVLAGSTFCPTKVRPKLSLSPRMSTHIQGTTHILRHGIRHRARCDVSLSNKPLFVLSRPFQAMGQAMKQVGMHPQHQISVKKS